MEKRENYSGLREREYHVFRESEIHVLVYPGFIRREREREKGLTRGKNLQ